MLQDFNNLTTLPENLGLVKVSRSQQVQTTETN